MEPLDEIMYENPKQYLFTVVWFMGGICGTKQELKYEYIVSSYCQDWRISDFLVWLLLAKSFKVPGEED